MNELKTVTQMVLECLEKYPETRNSDRALIRRVYEDYYDIAWQAFCVVIMRPDLPSFETIRRVRQKIQEEHEELRATKKVEDERVARQEEFIALAKGELE